MSNGLADSPDAYDVEQTCWQLDPAYSRVEFQVPHFYGLITVKGRFERYQGTLDLRSEPAVQLTIEADSLDTNNTRRDKHLRSADFFDVANHPQIQFTSDSATPERDHLKVHGQLHAAGRTIPLQLDATLRRADGELEIEAITNADHRELGMTWSPLGILRTPSKLIISGRLVRQDAPAG